MPEDFRQDGEQQRGLTQYQADDPLDEFQLDLPTVSAVRICCDGIFDEDLLVWLPEV